MRRSMERARHEAFLVIKAAPDDAGSRPLTTPYASPDIQVGVDSRPRVTVWNLGTRDVGGVTTAFYSVPAGLPVLAENARLVGVGNVAIIPAGESVTITCNQLWRRMSHADVLLAVASHPDLDPVWGEYDPVRDRHVGQMNYPWAGTFESRGIGAPRIRIEVRPANEGLFRVRLFEEVAGRMPSFPRCDRIMRPNRHTFRWLEVESNQKELYDVVMLDNNRLSFSRVVRPIDQPAVVVEHATGTLVRI